MNRKLKALGLAIVAVFAMAAVSAATASAEQWHAGATHGTVRGTNVGKETFTTKAGTVKCTIAEYNGSAAASTVSSQNVVPTYKECTAFGFVNTTIDVPEGCEFRFNTPVNTTSTVDIIGCPSPIVVTAFNCWVTVGNQNGLNHVVWSNVAGSVPMDIHATTKINNITYTQHSKSFPGCENGTFTNGGYEGTNTVRAFDTTGTQVDLTVT